LFTLLYRMGFTFFLCCFFFFGGVGFFFFFLGVGVGCREVLIIGQLVALFSSFSYPSSLFFSSRTPLAFEVLPEPLPIDGHSRNLSFPPPCRESGSASPPSAAAFLVPLSTRLTICFFFFQPRQGLSSSLCGNLEFPMTQIFPLPLVTLPYGQLRCAGLLKNNSRKGKVIGRGCSLFSPVPPGTPPLFFSRPSKSGRPLKVFFCP